MSYICSLVELPQNNSIHLSWIQGTYGLLEDGGQEEGEYGPEKGKDVLEEEDYVLQKADDVLEERVDVLEEGDNVLEEKDDVQEIDDGQEAGCTASNFLSTQ